MLEPGRPVLPLDNHLVLFSHLTYLDVHFLICLMGLVICLALVIELILEADMK